MCFRLFQYKAVFEESLREGLDQQFTGATIFKVSEQKPCLQCALKVFLEQDIMHVWQNGKKI